MSAANFQSAHLRPVVSKFGGMIAESAAVAIPPQAKTSPSKALDFASRHTPATSNVYAGSARRPAAAPTTPTTRAAPRCRALPVC